MTPERRIYGVVPPEQARTLSGLQWMQGWAEGRLPAPPIGQVFDFDIAQVEPGRVVFTGTPDARFYNPIGTVHGGYAATLLDSYMGCAVHTTLAPGQWHTTLEIKINYVRPMFENTGEVRCEASVINMGKTVATADGKLLDGKGRLIAHGTTTCMIFALP